MALSDVAMRKFYRCIQEMRRGRVSSTEMADDLLARLDRCGLNVSESDPDLNAMAATLEQAGYKITPPKVP